MLVIPLRTVCHGAFRGDKTQVLTAADFFKPQGQGQEAVLQLRMESRNKSSIFKIMITAEPQGADQLIDCFCFCRSLNHWMVRFIQSKYSV